MKIHFNTYRIQYNDYWGRWQIWHDEIGFVSEHTTLGEALEEARKG